MKKMADTFNKRLREWNRIIKECHRLKICPYCMLRAPINSDYVWCAPCAIADSLKLIGKRNAFGEIVTKETVMKRIENFKKLAEKAQKPRYTHKKRKIPNGGLL